MPDAVVHGRARDHRHGNRQNRRERSEQQHRALRDRQVAAHGGDERARRAGGAEQQHDFRLLEREQGRHVSARHVRDEDGDAVEHFLPRLLEEM